jgi:hypothetical protein
MDDFLALRHNVDRAIRFLISHSALCPRRHTIRIQKLAALAIVS